MFTSEWGCWTEELALLVTSWPVKHEDLSGFPKTCVGSREWCHIPRAGETGLGDSSCSPTSQSSLFGKLLASETLMQKNVENNPEKHLLPTSAPLINQSANSLIKKVGVT